MPSLPLTVDFKDIDKGDVALVGGKNANLGEMIKAGFPVPLGFAVTVHAYDLFLEENNLVTKIYQTLKRVDIFQNLLIFLLSKFPTKMKVLLKNSNRRL